MFFAKIYELHFKLLPHAPYLPDLDPSNYWIKKWLTGQIFTTKEEIIAVTNAYFVELNQSYYTKGMEKLERHWSKSIDVNGDYVEK